MCSYVEADRILSFNSREFIEAGDDKPCAAIAGCTAFSVFSRCRRTLKKYCHPRGQDEGGESVIGFDAVVDGHAPLLRSPRLHQPIPRLERKRKERTVRALFQTVLPRCCALDRNRFPSPFFPRLQVFLACLAKKIRRSQEGASEKKRMERRKISKFRQTKIKINDGRTISRSRSVFVPKAFLKR